MASSMAWILTVLIVGAMACTAMAVEHGNAPMGGHARNHTAAEHPVTFSSRRLLQSGVKGMDVSSYQVIS